MEPNTNQVEADPPFAPETIHPVELREVTEGKVRCEFLVDDGKTKFHLFGLPLSTKEVVTDAISGLFGPDSIIDWVPEVDSWYVQLNRTVPDGKLAAKTLAEMLNRATG